MSKGNVSKVKVIPFPKNRIQIQYKPIDPKDIDKQTLDNIDESMNSIEILLSHLRDDLMKIRMRIDDEQE